MTAAVQRVVIIGNGVAGISAARAIRKHSDAEITVISAESDHFFSRTALMYIFMGHMTYEDTKPYEDWFWRKNRIKLRRAWVTQVDTAANRVHLHSGEQLAYDALVLATGSVSNKIGWPGEDADGVQGLYSIQDLELMERNTHSINQAVIVGGGLIGVEMAEMLHSRNIPVTFLVREPWWMAHVFPQAEGDLIASAIRRHGIDLRLNTELARILPDQRGRVRAVQTKDGEELAAQFVGLTIGVKPNVRFLQDSGIEIDRGILVDEMLRTNVPNVYAVGDCAQLRTPAAGRRAIEPIWYTARIMGQTVGHTIVGQPTRYDPGIWFNSAKFFDVEYQVYGDIAPHPGATIETLYWASDCGRKSIRINYRKTDGAVVGFNLLGVRYRHELCNEWIRDGRHIRFVLENLGAANFDPELTPQHEKSLVQRYNALHPEQPVRLRRKRGLRSLLAARRAAAATQGSLQ